MLKRIFLLTLAVLAALAGWIAWRWLQQRQDEFGATLPQLAPSAPSWSPRATTTATPPAEVAEHVAETVDAAWHGFEVSPDEAASITGDVRAPEIAGTDALLPEPATQQDAPSPSVMEPDALDEAPAAAEATTEPDQPSAPVAALDETLDSATTPGESAASSDSADAAPGESAAASDSADTATSPAEAAETDDLDETGGVIGYCVRCKTKRAIVDAHEETTESGRRAARGTCPVCGANMFTFLPTEE